MFRLPMMPVNDGRVLRSKAAAACVAKGQGRASAKSTASPSVDRLLWLVGWS